MTDSPSPVERVARAIWEATHPNPPGWAAWGDKTGFGPSTAERERTIKQAQAAIKAMPGWMSIGDEPDVSVAPWDGKAVLLAEGEAVGEGNYHADSNEWRWANNHPTDHWGSAICPTSWAPLPSPPDQQEG